MSDNTFQPVVSVQAPLVKLVQNEPVVFWNLLAGVANLVQTLAISLPTWAHIAIVVVSWIGATMAARRSVTPNAKVNAPR